MTRKLTQRGDLAAPFWLGAIWSQLLGRVDWLLGGIPDRLYLIIFVAGIVTVVRWLNAIDKIRRGRTARTR